MPKGHASGRESKKSKKTEPKKVVPPPLFNTADVEVTGKRRRPKEE